jgi:addiction module RelE/StbE family toxin
MKIIFHKDFLKAYARLGKIDRKAVDNTIQIFQQNQNDSKLNNHALKGKHGGVRSLSVKFDLRILFIEQQNYSIVIMLEVGTHSQLYG